MPSEELLQLSKGAQLEAYCREADRRIEQAKAILMSSRVGPPLTQAQWVTLVGDAWRVLEYGVTTVTPKEPGDA